MPSSVEAKQDWILNQKGLGGGNAGPHPSSFEAFRAAVLNAVLLPTQQPGGQAIIEPINWSMQVFGPPPEQANLNGLYTELAVDPEAYVQGTVLGVPYAWDKLNTVPWGTIRSGIIPVPNGERDNGFNRNSSSANTTPSTPGVDGPVGTADAAWSNLDDAFCMVGHSTTRGGGAGPVVRVGPSNLGGVGIAPGPRIASNSTNMSLGLRNDAGLIGAISVGGLTPSTFYRWMIGVTRNSPGSSGFSARIRVYTSAGAFIGSSTGAVGGYAPGTEVSDGGITVHDTMGFWAYRGVDHTTVPATADAIMAAIVLEDTIAANPGGFLNNWLSGVRTGINDPGDALRLFLADGTPNPDLIAEWDRC